MQLPPALGPSTSHFPWVQPLTCFLVPFCPRATASLPLDPTWHLAQSELGQLGGIRSGTLLRLVLMTFER